MSCEESNKLRGSKEQQHMQLSFKELLKEGSAVHTLYSTDRYGRRAYIHWAYGDPLTSALCSAQEDPLKYVYCCSPAQGFESSHHSELLTNCLHLYHTMNSGQL